MRSHIAILKKKYMDLILSGRKTVESRITMNACEPFGKIGVGERIYLKVSSGPFIGITKAMAVDTYEGLDAGEVMKLYEKYDEAVCGGKAYWESKQKCRYASLIRLGRVEPCYRYPDYKKSMKAWHVIEEMDGVGENEGAALPCEAECGGRFGVRLTEGALRNCYVRLRGEEMFVEGVLELDLPGGERVVTDIVEGRRMVRWRGWGKYFGAYELEGGDWVDFVRVGEGRYRVMFRKEKESAEYGS